MFPTNAEINYRLGVIYALKGRGQEALQRLEVARASEPENASILMSEFTLLAQLGRPDQAEQVLRPYLEAHPEDARTRGMYNQVMRGFGRQPLSGSSPAPGGFAPGSVPGN